jgi:UDP-N-acetylglucosamine 2-epimerase (non-hydrolysing)
MKISVFFGTRPETIKLAPFIRQGRDLGHEVDVIFTGQHRDMALPLLQFFDIAPTVDLNCMRPKQDLASMSSLMLENLNQYPELKKTDALLVQGDTTSSFVGAYWAFLNKIPVIHLEAGLRTNNIMSPFPEEANRQLISRIASVHLAPTERAVSALAQEGVLRNVFNIGNTGIDALNFVSSKVTTDVLSNEIKNFIGQSRYVLITSHRRENFGDGMQEIAAAIKDLAQLHADTKFIFPVHLNPNVKSVMENELKGLSNVLLTSPQDYLSFVYLMKNASAILTDSGGVQEEAPSLKVPVVVMRESTERPEAVELGFAKLVGANREAIINAVTHALKHGHEGIGENPYGDGKSSERAWKLLSQTGVII